MPDSSNLLRTALMVSGLDSIAERDIVKLAAAGDHQAFHKLYELHKDAVFNIAFRITGDHAAAADVTQEVFLKAFRELPGFRARSKLSTWLYRVATNASIDAARKTLRTPTAPLDAVPDKEEPVDGASDPLDQQVSREADEQIKRAMLGIPPHLRAVLALRYIEGLSYEEIAEVLRSSVGTVKSRLFRAHKAIESRLSRLD